MLSMILPTLVAQFGEGFSPPVDPANKFVAGADSTPFDTLEVVISNSIALITVIAGIFFIFQFLLAAFSIISASGDSSKLTSATTKMLHAVIGLVTVIATYAIVGLVGSVIGLQILNPADILTNL